jgi:hypothetical protein
VAGAENGARDQRGDVVVVRDDAVDSTRQPLLDDLGRIGGVDVRIRAPGSYAIQLGESAEQIVAEQTVDLDGDVDAPQVLSLASTVGDWFGHDVVGPALMQAMMAGASEEQLAAADTNGNMLKMVESMPMGQFARFPGVEIPDQALDQLIALSAGGAALSTVAS